MPTSPRAAKKDSGLHRQWRSARMMMDRARHRDVGEKGTEAQVNGEHGFRAQLTENRAYSWAPIALTSVRKPNLWRSLQDRFGTTSKKAQKGSQARPGFALPRVLFLVGQGARYMLLYSAAVPGLAWHVDASPAFSPASPPLLPPAGGLSPQPPGPNPCFPSASQCFPVLTASPASPQSPCSGDRSQSKTALRSEACKLRAHTSTSLYVLVHTRTHDVRGPGPPGRALLACALTALTQPHALTHGCPMHQSVLVSAGQLWGRVVFMHRQAGTGRQGLHRFTS